MEEQLERKKMIIFISISFVILFGLVIILKSLQKSSQPQTQLPTPTIINYPSPTRVELPRTSPPKKDLPVPQSINNAPTYPPDKGQGIDIESEFIQSATNEVQKLYPYLPYLVDYQLSTGLTASIVIPAQDLQENPWSLTVQIFGIDYQVPADSQDYQLMKDSFREAANVVFEWMNSYGVDPQKLIVRWGDKALIKERAEEWLQ